MTPRLVIVALAVVVAACGSDGDGRRAGPSTSTTTTATVPSTTAAPAATTTSAEPAANPRPDWLGTRVLPRRPDGFGEIRPTPPELDPRDLVTVDTLRPPRDGRFHADVRPVAPDVAARSTWSPECPVRLEDLRHVVLSFWGFDARAHTGELLVHADAADAVVSVFRTLFAERFPIEGMGIATTADLDAPPTGDGNTTGAFVCRPTRGSTSWSQHAYGRAVDVNPFHNPYVRGDVVLPELASTYADRANVREGMIVPGGVVERAFDAVGWGWGGDWSSFKDWQHFSATGR